MPVPPVVTKSRLWSILETDPELAQALTGIRTVAAAISAKVQELIPDFTDHSVTHMDALWTVLDQVLTPDESSQLNAGEAFVLGASFYVHDLGMALAATADGRAKLEATETFRTTASRLESVDGCSPAEAKRTALRVSARELHASNALALATEALPGLDRFLIETMAVRDRWAYMIGTVAASHHWSLRRLDDEIGRRGAIPSPLGSTIDLGYLASLLRVVDFAHINCERAPSLERALRSSVGEDSVKHWLAQERIVGPHREGSLLVYASLQPIDDVDAWWIYYEMCSGLDKEIAAVGDYLRGRTASIGRFSLEGVKSIRSPQAFAALVAPSGFAPVDVRFRSDSVERLVDLLGGRTLYRNDQFAPIRELLQNARDAIFLRTARESLDGATPTVGEITVSLDASDERATLSVSDNGVGMSEKVISSYLLGIASNYWKSADLFSDFPRLAESTFSPVGRFGIGFLSVFMLGEDVEVRSQRVSGPGLTLVLHGVGRRGALSKGAPGLRTGTSVSVILAKDRVGDFESLARIVRARAPMLPIPIKVSELGEDSVIEPNWWQTVSQADLATFVASRATVATTSARRIRESKDATVRSSARIARTRDDEGLPADRWPGSQPELVTPDMRVVAVPERSGLVLCSKGFAIKTLPTSGLFGVINIGDVDLDASRSTPLEWDSEAFRGRILQDLKPFIVRAVDRIGESDFISSRYAFLSEVAGHYGCDVLKETSLEWITIVTRPGASRLVSAAEFKAVVESSSELVLAYGERAGPWTIPGISRSRYPDSSREALLVPISSAGQPDVGSYRDDDETFECGLREHFGANSRIVDYEEATLLRTIVELAAEARGESTELWESAPWLRRKRTISYRSVRSS